MSDLCPSCHVPELHLHDEDCPVRLKAEIEYLKAEVGKFQDLYDRELHDREKLTTPKWDHFTCAGEPELNCDDLQSLAEDWIGLERDDPPRHIYRDLRGPDAWLVWADGKWTIFDTEEEALNARNK